MATVPPPDYGLTKSTSNGPFKPPSSRRPSRKSQSPPPSKVSKRMPSPRSLIGRTVKSNKVIRVYSRPSRGPDNWNNAIFGLEDETDENPITSSTPVSSGRAEFIMPPTVEIPEFPTSSSSQSPSLLKRSSFIDPLALSDDDSDTTSPETKRDQGNKENSFCEPPEIDMSPLNRRVSSLVRQCPFCRKPLPASFTESPPTASRAKYVFCQRHENAEILEQGKSRGYPSSIDHIRLRSRIRKLLPEIKRVINSPTESEFLVSQRKKAGAHKNVAAPMIQMRMFEDSQPGYYGPQGAETISQIVMEKYGGIIRKNDKLFSALKFCGGVTGYVSSVLVPEVGIRLIMEDMDVKWEKARDIMKESAEYGAIANGAVEISDDDDDDDDSDMDSD